MNIFQYKPIIKYILDDINTINNLPDDEILLDSLKDFFRYNVGDTLNNLLHTLKDIDDIENRLKQETSKIEVPININNINDLLKMQLDNYDFKDKDRFINEGIITYDFYNDTKDIISEIKEVWHEYNSNINGNLFAELEEYLGVIKHTATNINVMFANLFPEAFNNKSIYDLKTNEFLKIENHLKNIEELNQGENEDLMNLSIINEKELQIKQDINFITNDYLINIQESLNMINDPLIEGFFKIYENFNASNKDYIKGYFNNNNQGQIIMYNSFSAAKEETDENWNYFVTINNQEVKTQTMKSVIIDTKVYKNICIPTLINLRNSISNESASNVILNGCEKIIQQYENTLLSYRNILNAEYETINEGLNNIYKKDIIRSMYN